MPASHPRESDDQSTKVFVLEAVQQLVAFSFEHFLEVMLFSELAGSTICAANSDNEALAASKHLAY